MLKEAKQLYDLGFAILWLREREKRPVKNKWTTGPRESWAELERTYQPGYNVGVRLGEASKLRKGYLGCIDVDVKHPEYRDKALEIAFEIFGFSNPPEVKSGSGGGSSHFYIVTAQPFKMITVAKVPDCYEVCIYSTGRQMVLPPSIHPSGRAYKWQNEGFQFPLIDVSAYAAKSEKDERTGKFELEGVSEDFEISSVDLGWIDISDSVREGILTGAGVEDRSAYLLVACNALLSAGLEKNEILTVLTDSKNFISSAAYERRGPSRKKAADWIWKYSLKKIMEERNAKNVFQEKAEVKQLTEKDAETQSEEIECENWRSELDKTKDGNIRATLKNVELFFYNVLGTQIFKRNEFNNRIVYGLDSPWNGKKEENLKENDGILIKSWFANNHGFEPNVNLIWEAIQVVAKKNGFHPVRDLINSVEWDGVERIDKALKTYMGAEMPEPYLSEISRKFFCAAIARIFSPGVKFDHMLVFESRTQGIGKSSAIEILASTPWFLDSLPNIRDKDAMLALQGIWFVEIAELAVLKRADSESYKAFFSSKVDKFRVPYGKHWEEEPRQCLFVGTTNNEDYLTDSTGNRRFWPCKVRQCDFKALQEDRLQLFAEAKVKWLAGEKLYLEGHALKQAKDIQSSRMVDDEESVMHEKLRSFEKKEPLKKFKISDLFAIGGPFYNFKMDSFHLKLAGRILRSESFEKYEKKGRKFWRKGGSPRVAHTEIDDF